MRELQQLVEVWRSAAEDFVELAEQLTDGEWPLQTDCPGWSVRDVVAHCAAIEAELAGDPPPPGATGDGNATQFSSAHTEAGVAARRDKAPAELIAEFRGAVGRQSQILATEPLDDPRGTPPRTPGGVRWDWATLMRNRPVDLWVHEQDIRRAVGRPGHLDSVAAQHTQERFAAALPFVTAKLAHAAAGAAVVFDVSGPVCAAYAVEVGADGRGRAVDATELETMGCKPVVRLTMDTETFAILCAGRRDPATLAVKVDGDQQLGRRILTSMAITP